MRTSGQHVKSRTYPPTKSPPPSSTLDPSCERHHYSSITQTRNLKAIFHCSASLMPHIPKMQEGKERVSHLAVSISLWLHRLELARPLCPWDSPGKNTGVGCHFLLQGIFLTQQSIWFSYTEANSLPYEPPGKPESYLLLHLSHVLHPQNAVLPIHL